jgi:preprotein translocase subunit SecD
MRKLIFIIALCLGVTVFAQAQTKKAPGKFPKALAAKLNLTPDQQGRVAAILQAKAASLDSLTSDTTTTKKASKTKRAAINSTADTKLSNVLTTDQQKVYADFKAEQKEKRKNKGAAATTTPPAN